MHSHTNIKQKKFSFNWFQYFRFSMRVISCYSYINTEQAERNCLLEFSVAFLWTAYPVCSNSNYSEHAWRKIWTFFYCDLLVVHWIWVLNIKYKYYRFNDLVFQGNDLDLGTNDKIPCVRFSIIFVGISSTMFWEKLNSAIKVYACQCLSDITFKTFIGSKGLKIVQFRRWNRC